MGGPRSEQESEATPDKELDSFQELRSLYIEASAAGISDAEFSKLTLTKLLARLEGEQLRRYWVARPILTAMMPHIDEKGLRSIVRSANSRGGGKPSLSGRALEVLLNDYLPVSLKARREARGARPVGPSIIKGLPAVAARGIMAAYERGDFHDNVVWVSVNPHFTDISATAKRGG